MYPGNDRYHTFPDFALKSDDEDPPPPPPSDDEDTEDEDSKDP